MNGMFLEGRNAYIWCLQGSRSLSGISLLLHLQVVVTERHPEYTDTYSKKGQRLIDSHLYATFCSALVN